MGTSVGYAMDYIVGLALFGLVWGILNLSYSPIYLLTADSDLRTIGNIFWVGTLIIYLIFGAFWLPRKIKEDEYMRGLR